jgi:hypothetical protein
VAPNQTGPNSQRGDNASASPKKAAVDPRWFQLPVKVAFWGDNDFSPCYFDLENKTLYRWKGVVLRSEQLPMAYTSVPSGLSLFDVKQFIFSVVPVEALVKYRESNGE